MSFKAGILNAYDWRNRGDRAIIEAQMAWIRTRIPDVEFRIFSACWKENIHAFGEDRSFPPPVSIPEGAGRLGGILGPLRSYAASSSGKGDGQAWEEFSTCDGYFLCGGGYLYSSHAPLFSRQLWIHAANALLALKSGKPVMKFPQSWGPFRKASDEWICRKLGEALPKISARGDISAAITGKMGFSDKTLNLPDVVIAISQVKGLPFDLPREPAKTGLGIAPIEFGFARTCSDKDREDYLGKLGSIATAYHRETGEPITLFVQVSLPGHDDDLPMAERLAAQLTAAGVPVTLENRADWGVYWERISTQAAFVGCRMHSCIFAMVTSVPTIGLAYQPKFQELFRELGMVERSFDISSFDPAEVTAVLLNRRFRSAESREELAAAVKASAERTIQGLDACWLAGDFPG
jgi:polysaccharide pyruvyl transferase WcaK-like protein